MRARSKKTAQFYRRDRVPFVAEQLAMYPVCERCGTRPSADVHEVVRRSQGGSTVDRTNTMCLCRECHDFIGANPAQATLEGFSRPSWSQRHPFRSEDGYYCRCGLPRINWRHARTEGDAA